jgi:hypothetical protein
LAGECFFRFRFVGGSFYFGLLNIFGHPKQGKSFLSLQFADAVSNPDVHSILGFPVKTHGPVLYLQLDTPRGLWTDRYEGSFRAAGVRLSGVLSADSLMVPYPYDILAEGGDWLRAACEYHKPVVVIVDTLREIHGGDENDAGSRDLAAPASAAVAYAVAKGDMRRVQDFARQDIGGIVRPITM